MHTNMYQAPEHFDTLWRRPLGTHWWDSIVGNTRKWPFCFFTITFQHWFISQFFVSHAENRQRRRVKSCWILKYPSREPRHSFPSHQGHQIGDVYRVPSVDGAKEGLVWRVNQIMIIFHKMNKHIDCITWRDSTIGIAELLQLGFRRLCSHAILWYYMINKVQYNKNNKQLKQYVCLKLYKY